MRTPHALAFDLLEAILTGDSDALDSIDSEIFSEDADTARPVLAAISALLVTALVNVHGEIGALQQIDQSRAAHAALWEA